VAVFGAVANAVYANTSGEGDAPAVVAASGAVFLSALVGGVLTVAAVVAMPAVKAGAMEQAGHNGGQQGGGQPDPDTESTRSGADT
jgi:hypothetical protein